MGITYYSVYKNSTGNVGIGTISPANKLDVVSATANNGSPFAGCFFSGDDSSAMWRCAVNLQHNANTTIAIGSSVGLSFAPLSSTSSNFYGSAAIKAVRPNTTANNQDTDLAFWTRTGASNNTVDAEKLRITGTGNVGIATTSPDVRLHVVNGTTKLNKNNYKTTTAYSTADLVLGDDASSRTGYTGNGSNLILHANGTTSITFLDQGRNLGEITYSNRLFTIGGDIGWGTASVSFPGTTNFGTNIYHSIGGQKFFAGSGGNYAYLYTGAVALNFLNSTDTSTLVTILNGGNVGIGTTSPGYKLDVSGTGRFTGDLTLSGALTTNVGGTSIFIGNQNVTTSNGLRINFHTDADLSYYIGKKAGAWTQPLDINFYTGIRLYASSSYDYGISFWNSNNTTKMMSVGEGDSNVRVANTIYATAFSGPLTGNVTGTATSISGFNNPTTAATANTIVYRDSGGDISTRYFLGSYVNSTDDTSSTGLTYIMAKFGNDYHRSASAAKVATFISGQTMDINGSSTSCSGSAASAGALNTNNDYTVASLTSNGFVYSGSGAGSTGAFYFNTSSHGIRRASGTNDVYCYTTSGTLYLGAGGSSTTHIRVLSGGDVGIGVSPSYKLDVNGNIHATGFPTSSDVRFKKNITPLENSLEKIKKLQGVRYEWNEFINNTRDGYKLNVPIIGLIAQEVEKVVPEIVDLWKLSDECQDARSIDYPRLIPLLIEAIKEQQDQIDELKNEIKSLKSN